MPPGSKPKPPLIEGWLGEYLTQKCKLCIPGRGEELRASFYAGKTAFRSAGDVVEIFVDSTLRDIHTLTWVAMAV